VIGADMCRCNVGRGTEDVRTAGGELIGRQCRKCTKLHQARCEVCHRFWRDPAAHQALSECGRFLRAGVTWRRDRRPGAPYAEAAHA
jgi:hypothetical protein